jgi:hypothetical protein
MKELSKQEIERALRYLDNPFEEEFPEELKEASELEILGLQLMLQQLKEEQRGSPIH